MTGSQTPRRRVIDEDHDRRGGRDHENAEKNLAENQVEAIRWIAGHCRFITTKLPRGELGVRFAARLLAAVPEACRRRVPDLTGTGPELVDRCVDFGLLAEVPSPRVVRAGLKQLAVRSPILEAWGKRCWTLWLVHLHDQRALAEATHLRAEVEPLSKTNDRLKSALDQALDPIELLREQVLRHERAGELGAAVFSLGKSLLRGRGGASDDEPDR